MHDKRPETLADLLAAINAPAVRLDKTGQPLAPRAPKQVTENDKYIAMMQRMIRGLETRAINDPAMLAQVLLLAQRLAEIVPVVVATSHDAYAVDPRLAPSMIECAALLGITKQSASERRHKGDKIIAARLAEHGLKSMSIAARERAARERAAAYAAQVMPKYHAVRYLRAV